MDALVPLDCPLIPDVDGDSSSASPFLPSLELERCNFIVGNSCSVLRGDVTEVLIGGGDLRRGDMGHLTSAAVGGFCGTGARIWTSEWEC